MFWGWRDVWGFGGLGDPAESVLVSLGLKFVSGKEQAKGGGYGVVPSAPRAQTPPFLWKDDAVGEAGAGMWDRVSRKAISCCSGGATGRWRVPRGPPR